MHRDTLTKHLQPFIQHGYVLTERKNKGKKFFLSSKGKIFFKYWKSGPEPDEMIEKLKKALKKSKLDKKISNEERNHAQIFIQDILEHQSAISFILNSDTFDRLVKKLADNELKKYSKIVELILALMQKMDPDAAHGFQTLFVAEKMQDEKRIHKSWNSFKKSFIDYYSN